MAKDNAENWRNYLEAYEQAWAEWQSWLVEAKTDIEYVLGKQISSQDESYLRKQGRKALVFNRTRKLVQTLSGYQRKTRLALKVDPVDGVPQTARQMTSVLLWLMQYADGYGVMSDAFEKGALTTGLNLVEVAVNYDDDPLSGDARFYRCPYNSFFLDPFFNERDLSDCRYILRRRWVGKADARALLPGSDASINQLKAKGSDNLYPYLPANRDWKGENLLRYDQFFRREMKRVTYLINPYNGDLITWEGTNRDLDNFLNSPFPVQQQQPMKGLQIVSQQASPQAINWGQMVQVIKRWKQSVKVSIFVEGREYYDGWDPSGLDDFPFIPVMGFWDPEYDDLKYKLQGIVRAVRDPQSESNKRRMKMLDILDSVISTGVKAKPGSLVDKRAAHMTGQGRVVWIKDQASLEDFQTLSPISIPPGTFESAQLMDQDTQDLIGLNAEIMGMPDKDDAAQAYILAKLRQASGLTIFQPLFDDYRAAKKLLGNRLMALVQENFRPEKVQRIIQEAPSEEFYTKHWRKYSAVPTEGVISDTQHQMAYAHLLGLRNMGAPIPWPLIFKHSPFSEIQEELMQGVQGQQQMQQMQMKIKLAAEQAKIAQAQGKAGLAKAQGLEILNKIQGMDHDRLLHLISLAMEIEQKGAFGLEAPGSGASQDNVVPMPGRQQMVTRR